MGVYQRSDFTGIFYAHRGLHDNEQGIPENSLPAFRAAAARGYGVELDVQLSSDGQVVVFHDDTLDRVCGVSGKVADRSLAELRKLRLLKTEETIPLFTEVLAVLREGAGPLIVELKTGGRNAELCEKTRELLRGYPGVYCIESFDPRIVYWFRKNAPEIIRGQLAQPEKDYGGLLPGPAAWLLAGCRLSFLNRPDFIAYGLGPKPFSARLCGWLGAMKVCWTARGAENHARRMKENDAVIFEYYRPEP